MEVGLLPSQFLSVVLEESDRNGKIKAARMNVSRNTAKSVTISPIVPKTVTATYVW